MFSFIWHTVFFDPIYNVLVFFIDAIPGGDVGLAVIATVVVVKTSLLPLSIKAAKAQKVMKELEPKLKELKEKHKDKRDEHAKATMALYKESGVNPFASIGVIFLQLPFMIALYFAVIKGGGVVLPGINADLLYSFVPSPTEISMLLFGSLDIASKSLVLAVVAGVAQYFSTVFTLIAPPPAVPGVKSDFKDDFARNMHVQMKYVMPVMIGFFAYISTVIAIYFIVSSIMAIIQEYFFIRKHR